MRKVTLNKEVNALFTNKIYGPPYPNHPYPPPPKNNNNKKHKTQNKKQNQKKQINKNNNNNTRNKSVKFDQKLYASFKTWY